MEEHSLLLNSHQTFIQPRSRCCPLTSLHLHDDDDHHGDDHANDDNDDGDGEDDDNDDDDDDN